MTEEIQDNRSSDWGDVILYKTNDTREFCTNCKHCWWQMEFMPKLVCPQCNSNNISRAGHRSPKSEEQ